MASKKQLLEELQKYNSDLETHLPDLNLDYLKNKEIFNSRNEVDEVVPLLANNLMDLKTEVALIRKNLVDSVEGMVLRMISDQQNHFANQIDKIFTQLLVEMKGGFSTYIAEIVNSISSMKKDINELKIQGSTFISKIEKFDTEIIELKSSTSDLNNLKRDINQNLDLKINELETKFDDLKILIENFNLDNTKTKRELVKNFSKEFVGIQDDNLRLNNKLEDLSKNLVSIQDKLNLVEKEKQEVIIKEVKVPEVKIVEKELVRPLEKSNVLPKKESVKISKNDVLKKNISQLKLKSNKSIEKLISIESRIKRLESLK